MVQGTLIDPTWLDCEQVAKRWGVAPSTIRNWIYRGGNIPGTTQPLRYTKVGVLTRFTPEDMAHNERYMQRQGRGRPRRAPRPRQETSERTTRASAPAPAARQRPAKAPATRKAGK